MVALVTPPSSMAPPPTPLTRPTLGLKRDSSYLDTDDEAALSSTTKKLKVAFSPNIDVKIMSRWSEKPFDLVREEVRLALERHASSVANESSNTHYENLVDVFDQDPFSADAMDTPLLRKYVVAIDSRVSLLGECGTLVSRILQLCWAGRSGGFVATYTKLLCDIAAAHATFLPELMERLVSNFAKLPASFGRLPGDTPVSRSTMFSRIHQMIKALVRHVPAASSALLRAVKLEFPNDLANTTSFIQFQRHLLRVVEYVPQIKSELLSRIVQRLVAVDVQIQQDVEELEEEAEEKVLQRRQSQDHGLDAEDSDDSDADSLSDSEETMTEEEQRLRDLRSKVAKMDGTLDLLFEYFTPLIEDGLDPESNEAYQQILSLFTSIVLPNRTRHTQFVLFHFSQISPAHTMLFADQCLSLLTNNSGSPNLRFAACSYLSSFVARGAHISSASVCEIVFTLCQYLDSLRSRYEIGCRGPDKRSFSLYYAVAQALLYIFCFKWRDLVIGSSLSSSYDAEDLLAEGRDLTWLPGFKEKMHRNIYSKINPLKVCSPAIVGEFAKIAHHLRFLYVFPLLETNKRVRLGTTFNYYGANGIVDISRRETAWDMKKGEAHHQLEAYFPFDPYHLPVSKKWVANDYNEWKLPKGMRQGEDDEEEDGCSDSEKDEESLYGESEDEDDSDNLPLEDDHDDAAVDTISISS